MKVFFSTLIINYVLKNLHWSCVLDKFHALIYRWSHVDLLCYHFSSESNTMNTNIAVNNVKYCKLFQICLCLNLYLC